MTDVRDEAARSITAAHVRMYEATGGLLGGWVGGMPVLLLRTTGRRSGEKRTTPLTYLRIDGRIFVVASYGGAKRHPDWFLNLDDDHRVEVQRGRSSSPMIARTIHDEDRDRIWSRITLFAPIYRWYQSRTDREIPVVELIPTDDQDGVELPRDDVDLDSLTKNELMRIAGDIDLRGRSKMSKAELLRALREREAEIGDAARGI